MSAIRKILGLSGFSALIWRKPVPEPLQNANCPVFGHSFQPPGCLFSNLADGSKAVLMARGRDATDVALSTTYGANILKDFKVVTVEAEEADASAMPAALTLAAMRRWYGTDVAV